MCNDRRPPLSFVEGRTAAETVICDSATDHACEFAKESRKQQEPSCGTARSARPAFLPLIPNPIMWADALVEGGREAFPRRSIREGTAFFGRPKECSCARKATISLLRNPPPRMSVRCVRLCRCLLNPCRCPACCHSAVGISRSFGECLSRSGLRRRSRKSN